MRFQLALAVAILALARGAWADDAMITLAVRDGGFDPRQVEAPAGARIQLEVTNQTSSAIEFESFELNRERVIPPDKKVVVYLSGLSAGQYEFFDDFHHERRGTLVVR